MSSIADKLKKYLPDAEESANERMHGAGSTLALDNIETLQPLADEPSLPRTPVASPSYEAFQAAEPAFAAASNAPAAADSGGGAAQAVAAALRVHPARQLRIFAIALAVVVLLLLLVAGSAILRADRLAQQVASTGQALMQSQRLAKSVSQALVGNGAAFTEVRESSDDLTRRVQGLASGDESLKLERVGGQIGRASCRERVLYTV